MMSIFWPTSLPKYPDRAGFSGEFKDAMLRSKPDVGPAKVRRRATAAPEPFTASWLLTWYELQTLRAFYHDDLEMGSLPFYANHPVDYNVELITPNRDFELGNFLGWTQINSLLTGVENFLDDFDDSSLANIWGSDTAGGGSVTETSALALNTSATSDGAIVYGKERYVRSTVRNLGVKAKASGLNNSIVFLSLKDESSAPVAEDNSVYITKFVIDIYQGSGGDFYIRYVSSGGTVYYWDGSAWDTPNALAYSGSVGTDYQVWVENDGTQWRVVIKSADGGTTHTTTGWVTWANTRDLGNNLWFLFGDPWTTIHYGTLTADWVKELDATAYSGSYCSKLVGDGSGWQGSAYTSEKYIDPTEVYTAKGYHKVTYHNSGSYRVRIRCLDDSDALAGTIDLTVISAAQDWTLLEKTIGPAGSGADKKWPAGTVKVNYQGYMPSASLFTAYMDDVSLVGPKVSRFQFTDKPTYRPVDNLWEVSARLEVLP